MNSRLKSAIATIVIQGALAYGLIMGLVMTISPEAPRKLTAIEIAPKPEAPPPPPLPAPPKVPPTNLLPMPPLGQPVILKDWATASVEQRNIDFMKAHKWVQDNMPEEEQRLIKWREELPRGSGPGRVARLRPPGLATHTLYWPANWSRGKLPIVAWGNDFDGKCSNSSLPYAAFLAEIASHGYFIVAVGNDDIDYPQPEGLAILADGRPIRTQASALTRAIDWAIAENGRGGSPYAGKLDTGKIAYMGHGCGGGQALAASADPRATTAVLLNAAARLDTGRASIAHFEGARDDRGVIEAGDANFAKAEADGRPMFKAALDGLGHDGAYAAPNRRWSRAVLAWLDWQLKGDGKAAAAIARLSRDGWSRVDATGLTPSPAPAQGDAATSSLSESP